MRPEILFPLFAKIDIVEGIGPKTANYLQKSVGGRVRDVILTPPNGMLERKKYPNIASSVQDEFAILHVHIDKHQPGRNRRQPYKVLCSDETGALTLSFFHARADYLKRVLPEGGKRIVSGKIEVFRGERQINHPDYILPIKDVDTIPEFETQYPLTAGLSQKMMRKAVAGCFTHCPDLPEWIDPHILKLENWLGWKASLQHLHFPNSRMEIGKDTRIYRRLAYDELLAKQMALALVRERNRKMNGRAFIAHGEFVKEVMNAAPFTPTQAQMRSFEEISKDLESPNRMSRLLQGDVGAGKTFVAALAAAHICEAGAQVAIMAPTEILARQHQKALQGFLTAANLTVTTLTARDKGKPREAILSGLKKGHIDVLCGTHALFQDRVAFKNLGLVIVDEQHRFGVLDRMKLSQKGQNPDLLVMTATPIPRTLALTAYGDMEISRLDEKPAGRKPIDTRIVPVERMDAVIAGLNRVISRGEQIYWVCPLVEDSESMDLASAEERFRHLSAIFPGQVALLHGRLKAKDKEAIAEGFKKKQYDILVATTVIEVGVDSPGATVMVIEHAERFGLAQLHQLRGRVGRNDKQSSCILLYKGPLGVNSKARLSVMRETNDGFVISEKDWELRGSGDLLGSRQSGLPDYRFVDIDRHQSLLEMAVRDAKNMVQQDPQLASPRAKAILNLLYLYEQDVGVRLMNIG